MNNESNLFFFYVLTFFGFWFFCNFVQKKLGGKYFCTNCSSEAYPKRKSRTKAFPAILLLCLGIIPGVIYIVVTSIGQKKVCGVCSGEYIIKAEHRSAQQSKIS